MAGIALRGRQGAPRRLAARDLASGSGPGEPDEPVAALRRPARRRPRDRAREPRPHAPRPLEVVRGPADGVAAAAHPGDGRPPARRDGAPWAARRPARVALLP